MSADGQARPRSTQIRKIGESASRAVWGAFGAQTRRTGEPPTHEDIQDMIAQPAADAMLDLQDLLPLEDSELYCLIRVLLAAGPKAAVREEARSRR